MNQETHPRLNITKNPELLHSSPGSIYIIKNKIKYGCLKYNKNIYHYIYVRNPSKINLKRKDE